MYVSIVLATWFSLSNALYTTKGSPCAVACGTKAQNFTGTGDLVCLDTAYDDSTKGVLYRQCVTCLSNSTYINDALSYNSNSDQFWYLWHIKYVQQYCLIDTPQTAAAENCADQCNPLQDPLDVSWIYNKEGVQPEYAYCSWNSSQYTTYAKDCATCLQGQDGGVIIGNMADTTYNACKTQPMAANGELVSVSRDLFDSSIIDGTQSSQSSSTLSQSSSTAATASTVSTASTNTTTSTVSPSLTTSAASANTATSGATTSISPVTTSAASSASAVATAIQSKSGGLSSVASAGIGVGATLVVIALAAGLFFLFRRKKRATYGQASFAPAPAYVELGSNRQVSELGGPDKGWWKGPVVEVEAKSVQLQELHGSPRQT